MAQRDRDIWRVVLDSVAAGEQTIKAEEAGQVHCLLGFFITPEADGTYEFNSDTDAGGAGTETSLSGVHKMIDGVAIGYRSQEDIPIFVTEPGEALVLETVTADVSGFFFGYTEGE